MTAQAPLTGRPLPAPLGDAVPAPRRPVADTLPAALTATVEVRALTAGPAPDLTPDLAQDLAAGLPSGTRTETARIALARARLRGVPMPDVVVFVSACPSCGQDAEWHEEREDTRLRVTVVCDC